MRKSWILALVALFCVLASPLIGGGFAGPGGPFLVAELPDSFFQTNVPLPYNLVPDRASFVLGYNLQSQVINGKEGLTSDSIIGPGKQFQTDACAYFDFNDNNCPDFAKMVEMLTNGQDDIIWLGIMFHTASGDIIRTDSDVGYGSESMAFRTSADLAGFSIDFVRLVVNNLTYVVNNETISYDYDVVWQFWSGPPDAVAGGGQRSAVNDFLKFLNPLKTHVSLPIRVTRYPIAVQYGPTIDPSTFQAVLNGVDIASQYSFEPSPGTSKTVAIPIFPGRNVLKLQVDGLIAGRTATDRDTLTIICP
jgi:hypothetical protein